MKYMINFMADSTDKAREQERERVFQSCRRRPRTKRDNLGGLKLADNSPPYPHHQYVSVNPRPKLMNITISLSLPAEAPGSGGDQESAPKKRKLDSDSFGEEPKRIPIRERDQEKKPHANAVRERETEKKEKRILKFDLSDKEELERRSSKGIVIWDADQEKKPFADADREKETKKKKKKKDKGKEKCIGDYDEFKPDKKLKKKKSNVIVNLPTPELPSGLIARIAEKARVFGQPDIGPVVLVIHKELMMSDITRQQNRLTIPLKQVREQFLKPEEEAYLSNRIGSKTAYIPVPIIEPTGAVSHVTLRKWDVGKNSVSYILNGDWKHVVSLNGLREGQIVTVWAFWIMEDLNLAFVFSENRQREDGASTSQAPAVVETVVTPPTASVAETETVVGTGDSGTEARTGASGSEEDSKRRSGGLDFDLNMEPDEF